LKLVVVIDASAALASLLQEQPAAAGVEKVIAEHSLIAPDLWLLEVTNAVLTRERRKIFTPADAERLLQAIDALPMERVARPLGQDARLIYQLARPHQLTAYDATYLDLSLRRGLPLCTLDRNLRAAAERVGVAVLP
jgi:predicted nucleic acid-binding protein